MLCNALVWSLNAVAGISWLELIKAAAPLATAAIAYTALQNWRRQDRAKREAEFLDQLVETTHTFVDEMAGPLTHIRLTKAGFEGYEPSGGVEDMATAGMVAYIAKRGEEDSKRMLGALNSIQPTAARLTALATKGQVFRFEGYETCKAAATRLALRFSQVQLFAGMIGATTLNWENPEVRNACRILFSADPEAISDDLKASHVTILEFATAAYRRLYG
ncbi:hypothetical protein DX912_11315 [Lysobacter soli]|uniref:Uncharacterized protein n=1 Tax=Lysobacter soli TaxID=453783 RepID=A0A3D8VCY2_9GAMM|nr:hypothetical protein [Lysobacter soli]RDY66708.1 hypothetical protein DX912_11315 [Lysobacter soli]